MDSSKIRKKLKATRKKAETRKKTKSSCKGSGNQESVEMPEPLQTDGKNNAGGFKTPGVEINQEEMPSAEDHVGSDGKPEGEGLDEPAEDIIEVLAFRLSGRYYAFRLTEVEEILNEQRITFVPRVNPFLLGITSIRGKILPVLDIVRRLSLAGGVQTEGRPKTVVLKGPRGPIGVVLSGAMDIKALQERDITSPPVHIEGDGASFIGGTATTSEMFISIINTEKMLDFEGTGEAR